MCAARASGVRIFHKTNESIVTGCTAHPGHETKCFIHRKEESPVLDKIPKDIKVNMHRLKTRSGMFSDDRENDEVFIVEAILKREHEKYLVKCIGYEPEWMPMNVIPTFILEHFHNNGKTKLPQPHILSTTSTGNIVYNTLTWTGDPTLPTWTPEMFADYEDIEDQDAQLRCNTKKDKDSRFHRHTAGIFIGCWPCGVCVLWDELYGSENIRQVFGIITDWLRYLTFSYWISHRLKRAMDALLLYIQNFIF